MHRGIRSHWTWRLCLISFTSIFLMTLMPFQHAYGQHLELNGGWVHMTENNGTDGFEGGVAWWFNNRISLAANYDGAWDTSSLTNFAPTPGGLISTHSHIQNFLIGPRIFFSTQWADKHKLNPFGEVQLGQSWLDQKVTTPTLTSSASDSAFSWMLGGGVEYLLNPHWSARMNVDLLRTHFAEEGQSHLRFIIGLTYTIGARGAK